MTALAPDGALSPPTVADQTSGPVRRYAVMALVVGSWMALGWMLRLGAVAYLLVGIPLTIAFQVLVARRPIPSLWVLGSRELRLDRGGMVLAAGLAILPLYVTIQGALSGHILDVGYGLTGVVGAVPAAVALRGMGARARRSLVKSILTAGVVGAVLFLIDRIISQGTELANPAAAGWAFATSLLLYVPMVFIIEEVFFRGALDTYARGFRGPNDVASAVVVSLLWGIWHLPLIADDGLGRLPVSLAFHLVLGLLLTGPWRQSGNLAVPGVTHAVIDAVRDGLRVA